MINAQNLRFNSWVSLFHYGSKKKWFKRINSFQQTKILRNFYRLWFQLLGIPKKHSSSNKSIKKRVFFCGNELETV